MKDNVFQRQRCNYFTSSRGEKHKKHWCFRGILLGKLHCLCQSACVYFCHENCPSVTVHPEVTTWWLWTSCFLPFRLSELLPAISLLQFCLFFPSLVIFPSVNVSVRTFIHMWCPYKWAQEAVTEMSIQPQHCHLTVNKGNYRFKSHFSLHFHS